MPMTRSFGSKNKKNGFSIVEVLISISIIVVLSGISFSVFKVVQKQNILKQAFMETIGILIEAQILARSGYYDSSWGVYLDSGEVTIFKGNSFSGRDTTFDKYFSFSDQVSFSGDREIIFYKSEGNPDTNKTIILMHENNNENIYINKKGLIFY